MATATRPAGRRGLGLAIGAAVAGQGPAVVLAGLHVVEFIAAAGAVLGQPQLVGARFQGGTLGVAVAQAPEAGLCAGGSENGVVGGNAAVAIQAHHLAQRGGEVLRVQRGRFARAVLAAIAGGQEQRLVAAKDDARAEVHAAVHLRCLAPDHSHAVERAAGQAAARQGRAHAAGAVLRIAEVHPWIGREVRVQGHVEQATLAAAVDGGQPGQRGVDGRAVGTHDHHAAVLLRHQDAPVGQEGQAPRAAQGDIEHGRLDGCGGLGRRQTRRDAQQQASECSQAGAAGRRSRGQHRGNLGRSGNERVWRAAHSLPGGRGCG